MAIRIFILNDIYLQPKLTPPFMLCMKGSLYKIYN